MPSLDTIARSKAVGRGGQASPSHAYAPLARAETVTCEAPRSPAARTLEGDETGACPAQRGRRPPVTIPDAAGGKAGENAEYNSGGTVDGRHNTLEAARQTPVAVSAKDGSTPRRTRREMATAAIAKHRTRPCSRAKPNRPNAGEGDHELVRTKMGLWICLAAFLETHAVLLANADAFYNITVTVPYALRFKPAAWSGQVHRRGRIIGRVVARLGRNCPENSAGGEPAKQARGQVPAACGRRCRHEARAHRKRGETGCKFLPARDSDTRLHGGDLQFVHLASQTLTKRLNLRGSVCPRGAVANRARNECRAIQPHGALGQLNDSKKCPFEETAYPATNKIPRRAAHAGAGFNSAGQGWTRHQTQ